MFNKKLLFISHAENDSKLIEKFVDLLYDMGIPEKSMFCSLISEKSSNIVRMGKL